MSGTNKRTRKPGNKATRRAAYLKLRTEHPTLPASSLFRWTLENMTRKPVLDDIEWRDGVGKLKRQGFDIVISTAPDDTGYRTEEGYSLEDLGLGLYTSNAKPGDIARFRPGTPDRGQLTHYRPSQSFSERLDHFKRGGMARGPAWLAAKLDERAEMRRADEYASGDRCPVSCDGVPRRHRAWNRLARDVRRGRGLPQANRHRARAHRGSHRGSP